MSFNVTQCPSCESTFNTNSRVLAAAAGKVRCGACLNVFEAIDNFLTPEETDAAQDQDESVFVGNDPQEFFDPSSFLTRSALNETHGDEPVRDYPIDEQHLHQDLEQSETASSDFFATVTGELQGRTEAPVVENRPEDEEQQSDRPEDLQTSIADESIDEEFEEDILHSETETHELTEDDTADSWAEEYIESEPTQPDAEELHIVAEATDAHELTENGAAGSSFEARIGPEPEPEPEPANAEEMQVESTESFLGSGLSASFTFNPHAPPQVRIGTPESDSPADNETASEQLVDSNVARDAEAEFNEDNERQSLDTQAEALEADDQALYDSANLPMDDEVTGPPANDEATPAFAAEEATTEALPIAEPSTAPEAIEEPAADIENTSIDIESPSVEADDTPSLTTLEELASESAAEDEESIIEVPQTSAQEVDEDSTEAIRSRALEAELSDEEALEAIPRENLAALGKMSMPVELLARKESRLLRSTLLFLSILLFGGLLCSQYLWQRMELYSQHPQLRPGYEVACTYINCTLPEYADIDSIRSENLTVQTHPTFANSLMVNTVIRNTAAFEQPFPILILSFNSVENSVIALREFTSAEYLAPELSSVQTMPAKTPVQIGLAIMDPGPEAVNYTLAFRWP